LAFVDGQDPSARRLPTTQRHTGGVTNPLRAGHWLREPRSLRVDDASVAFTTSPRTDLWQRTYYGFRTDNAPALLFTATENITFTVRVSFDYRHRYDQAGVLVRSDSDHWGKASVEYEDRDLSRLGSVVTNRGYSDWATRDIPTPHRMWYQVSRRGPDFLVQACADGVHWEQLRIFHLHDLGETTEAMGAAQASDLTGAPVSLGIYACSPEDSSFEARFDRISVEPSTWAPHS
jgi:regulation of enolase protein 1 (concanavalin A-like superfamily)